MPLLVRDSVEMFLLERGSKRKPATVRHYRSRLSAFVRELGDREAITLTAPDVLRYFQRANQFADGRSKAADTIRANFIVFDQWQKFAKKGGHLAALLITDLEIPAGRERDRIPTSEETDAILRQARPAFVLMYRALRLSGARPGELIRATIANIDWPAKMIRLADHKTVAKTKKPRRIPIGDALEPLIRQAIGERTGGAIFLTDTGRPWTLSNLGQTFRKIRAQANLPKDLVMYLARHEFASRLIESGVDIHAVAQSLGHHGLKTVGRYVKVKDDTLVKWQNRIGEDHPPADQAPPKAA